MTLAEIAALTLDDVFYIILDRLVDQSGVPEGEDWFTTTEGVTPLYERTTLHVSLTKPTLQEMEDDLVVYKAELTAVEEARIAEVERQLNLRNRIIVIYNRDNGFPAFYRIVAGEPNAKKYLHDLITDPDRAAEAENLVTQIEAEDLVIQGELSDADTAEQARRDKVQDFKNNLAADINGMNIPNRLKLFLKYLLDKEEG